MAWKDKSLSAILEGLAVLKELEHKLPGNWTRRQRSSSHAQDKTRKDMAGTAWDCNACGCYNFGYRI
eukprot:4368667-Amphidinium_carterae.1